MALLRNSIATQCHCVESQRDGQVIASDANPRLCDKTNSQSRNATACVGCRYDFEHEHEHEHGAGRMGLRICVLAPHP